MSTIGTVRASVALLNSRDRRILVLVAVAQMSTALLDLFGVLLIGVVTALSVSIMSDSPPPSSVSALAEWLGWESVDTARTAAGLAVIAGALLVSKSLVNMAISRRFLKFLANRQATVSGRLAAGLLSRPLIQVQQRSSQTTVYALTSGVSAATLSILGQGIVAISEITLLIVLAIGVLIVSPFVTLFAIAFFVIIAIVLHRLLSGWAGRLGLRSSVVEIGSYASMQEALRSYREVVVSNRRGLYVSRFQELRKQAADVQSDTAFLNLIPKYIFEIALIIGAGLLAGTQLLTKDLTSAVAVIAVFLAAGSRVVPSMLRLQTATINIRGAAGSAAPTFELAEELEDQSAITSIEAMGERINITKLRQELQDSSLSFRPSIAVTAVELSYPGTSRAALQGIDLMLDPGRSVGLVGPTGAGKSTLADVILGVLVPDSGTVEIGGVSPREAITKWPGALAYVPQDVAMADGTVRDNVALGLPRAAIDDEWVWDALERAHLAEFLRDSRDGIDTVIGEHGIRLSGGQRQRLGVARALYTRPKLLVLDEATSALDAETESAISQTLQELEGTVTTVTIAHRLATIRHCDLVLYLEDGKVAASGTFDEVRLRSPKFNNQAKILGL